jgi:hypothetical protein
MSSSAFERLSGSAASSTRALTPLLVYGAAPILQMGCALKAVAERSGQPGAMNDLDYFLARPQLRRKTPCLVTLPQQREMLGENHGELEAAVLLYEHHVAGYGIRIFATDETTGRRTLVSIPEMRARFALTACQRLLVQGAQVILISFRNDEACIDTMLERLLQDPTYSCRWASREREIAGHLPLESNLDATLAKMGARTRHHLRYYRRRAESQLACVFVPDVKISREDFLEMNRISSHRVSDEIAAWRYDSLQVLKEPILYGMRDRDGQWISLIGGRHYDCNMEMYWQMNRDLQSQSVGTAMRAFLIEHEVARGTRRMYIEGGTNHSMSHAFVREKATDLIVMRQSLITPVLASLVRRFLPPENMMAMVLEDTTLEWRSVRKSA